jgi:hypothetical protein
MHHLLPAECRGFEGVLGNRSLAPRNPAGEGHIVQGWPSLFPGCAGGLRRQLPRPPDAARSTAPKAHERFPVPGSGGLTFGHDGAVRHCWPLRKRRPYEFPATSFGCGWPDISSQACPPTHSTALHPPPRRTDSPHPLPRMDDSVDGAVDELIGKPWGSVDQLAGGFRESWVLARSHPGTGRPLGRGGGLPD